MSQKAIAISATVGYLLCTRPNPHTYDSEISNISETDEVPSLMPGPATLVFQYHNQEDLESFLETVPSSYMASRWQGDVCGETKRFISAGWGPVHQDRMLGETDPLIG